MALEEPKLLNILSSRVKKNPFNLFLFNYGQRENYYLSPSNHAMFYFLYINNIFDHLIIFINIIIIWIFISMFEDWSGILNLCCQPMLV